MNAEFKLVGLTKGLRATLELLDTDKEIFHAKVAMSKDKFDALWKYLDNHWDDGIKIAEVECDYLTPEGIPVNAVMTGFKYKNYI